MAVTFEHEPLRVWRARHELTQRELAERAGVGVQTVFNAEKGNTRPSPLVRKALADALGTDAESVTELR